MSDMKVPIRKDKIVMAFERKLRKLRAENRLKAANLTAELNNEILPVEMQKFVDKVHQQGILPEHSSEELDGE